jgi:hypothetical protein
MSFQPEGFKTLQTEYLWYIVDKCALYCKTQTIKSGNYETLYKIEGKRKHFCSQTRKIYHQCRKKGKK